MPVANIIPAVDKKNVSRTYLMNDTVCCEVIEVIPDTDKMVCGMKGVTRGPDDPPPMPPLGLLSTDDFPLVYKYVLPFTQIKSQYCHTFPGLSITFLSHYTLLYHLFCEDVEPFCDCEKKYHLLYLDQKYEDFAALTCYKEV